MPPTAGGGVDRPLTMNSSRRPRRGTRRKPPPFSRSGSPKLAQAVFFSAPTRLNEQAAIETRPGSCRNGRVGIMDQVSPPDESAEPSCRAGVQSRPQRYPLGERKLKRPFMTVGIELVSSEVHRSAVQSLLHLPSTLPSHDRDDLHFPIL